MSLTMIQPTNAEQTIKTQSTRNSEEASFIASDGQEIFYRFWRGKNSSPESKRATILFHRGHEHSARWQEFVNTSEMPTCWFFAWDARGHGLTRGERGAAESFSRLVQDADEFANHLCQTYGIEPNNTAVVGQSVGAVIAATWIHDYAPPVRAMVLATPALRIKLYMPLAITGLRLLNRIRPNTFIKSYVRPGMLTHDLKEAEAYATDPLISPQIATNILLDLHDTSTRLIDDASAIHISTLMFVSEKDYVVRQDAQRTLFDRLSSNDKQLIQLDDFYHSTFWEKDRTRIIKQTAEFLKKRFADKPPRLTADDLANGSRERYERLHKPASTIATIQFGLQRFALSTIAKLSRGVRIGWKSGFDSGQSLDHVYRNRAEGTTFIGRMIDRNYLNSIGWKGIRQRKVHMERLLDEAIAQAVEQFGEVTILDVAAGPGRYVLETIKRNDSLPIRAILCDRDPGGIEEGHVLAKQLGISDRVEFRQSDAFDPNAIRNAVDGAPVHIAIASGLYELFPDNVLIRRSLSGVGSVLVDNGWLLYTDQPWHPQQEMIARVLPNRDGEPWIMRCRSQAEMDALVSEAGTRRHSMAIDRWGIFSVALARKIGKSVV